MKSDEHLKQWVKQIARELEEEATVVQRYAKASKQLTCLVDFGDAVAHEEGNAPALLSLLLTRKDSELQIGGIVLPLGVAMDALHCIAAYLCVSLQRAEELGDIGPFESTSETPPDRNQNTN